MGLRCYWPCGWYSESLSFPPKYLFQSQHGARTGLGRLRVGLVTLPRGSLNKLICGYSYHRGGILQVQAPEYNREKEVSATSD